MRTPFTILALGPFRPLGPNETPKPAPAALDLWDALFAAMGPTLRLPAPLDLAPDGAVDVPIAAPGDFRPDRLLAKTALGAALNHAETLLEAARLAGETPESARKKAREAAPFLDFPAPAAPAPASPESAKAASLIDDLLTMTATPTQPATGGGFYREALAVIHKRRSALASLVFDHPEFRRVEDAWRGLETLLKQADVKSNGPVRVLACAVDPEDAGGFEASLTALGERFSADPPDLILVDAAINQTPVGLAKAAAVAALGGTLLCPTIIGAGPGFFHLDSWRELSKLGRLPNLLEDAAYAKYRKFRTSPDAPWLMIGVNGFLVRPVYGLGAAAKGVDFAESAPLYCSPVWGLGTLVAQAAGDGGGFASRFTDAQNARLRDLAFQSPDSPLAVEFSLGGERLREFLAVGLTPLAAKTGEDWAQAPLETTVDGGSLAQTLILSRVIKAALQIRDGFDGESDPLAALKAGLLDLFTQAGLSAPAKLTVERAGKDESGRKLLGVSFTPPPEIWRGEALGFTLAW